MLTDGFARVMDGKKMIKRLVSIMLIYCLFCGFNVQSMHSGVLARKNAGGAVEDGLVGFNGSPTTTLNDTSAHQGYLYGGGLYAINDRRDKLYAHRS